MSIPFVKDFDFTYAKADQLSPLVRRVICENPGPFTYTGSGTYLIGDKKIAIIDPGPANQAHMEALLTTIGKGKITHIFVTHTHVDHCGGVADLKAATGAIVYGYGAHPSRPGEAAPMLDEGSDFSYAPDEILRDGNTISTDEWSLTSLHTPGHISNHLCYDLREEKALFTGDHMMGWATTVVAVPDGNMADYLASLDLLLVRDDHIYYPTHGAPITNPRQFTKAVKIHRDMRDLQILRQLEKGPQNIMDMVSVIYAGVDKRLHLAAALNVQAHLERHIASGKVSASNDAPLKAEYRLA